MAFLVTLDGRGLAIGDVVRVARGGAAVALHADARERVRAARAIVEAAAQSDASIYGLTSALGANTGQAISTAERSAYQVRAVRARAVGVGAPLATDVVRATMLARAAGMAVGGSGVSPAVLDALVAMLNAGVHPIVPSVGSIGAADLPQLSHLALPLVGEGQAEFRGETLPGAEALARAGLKPVALGAKDGLALIGTNAATLGQAALALHDAACALDAFHLGAALTHEGFRAHLGPLDARVQAARPARGQLASAARLRELLVGSALWQPGAARRVQDPLSLRCVTQVHGAAIAALQTARDDVELELNSATESPLVLPDAPHLVSNGNFHVPALALAIDSLRIALAHVAQLAVMRCQKLYAPALSGLPLQLTTLGPAHSGFATLQKTLVSLLHRLRHAAQPTALDSLPVSETTEDDASMAFDGVVHLASMIEPLRLVAAIEWLSAAQAVDLRPLDPASMGAGAAAAYALVRAGSPRLDEDRPLGPEVDALAGAIARSALCTPYGLAR